MIVEVKNVVEDRLSCNFCDKGDYRAHNTGFVYPYKEVFTFIRDGGNGLCPSICKDCLIELIEKSKLFTDCL